MRALRTFIVYFLLIACTASTSEGQTVYITKTGAKYHKGSCQYLRKSKIPITIKEAADRGYEPCSVCEPGSAPIEKKSTSPSETNKPKEQAVPKTTTPAKTSDVKSTQCTAMTKAGTRCKRMTTDPSGRCYQHK